MILGQIKQETDKNRQYRLMEFCGGHTYALASNALEEVLPDNIKMIHGPGCPVCVLPAPRISLALEAVAQKDVILCSYGDVLRVPDAEGKSLLTAKAEGADIRMVYSILDALQVARENKKKKVIFFAIGFETTAPLTAAALLTAKEEGLENFFIINNHVLTSAALEAVLLEGAKVDGIIGPGHVCAVTGLKPFAPLVRRFQKPLVATGFEANDILRAILMLVKQINVGSCKIENEYSGVVTEDGNRRAMALMNKVFANRADFEWRGLGVLPASALDFADDFKYFDALEAFNLKPKQAQEHKHCECANIIKGNKTPLECPLFAVVCCPDNPIGACMVSSEGACAAYYKYKRA